MYDQIRVETGSDHSAYLSQMSYFFWVMWVTRSNEGILDDTVYIFIDDNRGFRACLIQHQAVTVVPEHNSVLLF